MAPEYLCELVSFRNSSPKLRSSSQRLLQVPLCLGSGHMVIVPLELQPPLWEIRCRQILEMHHLLKILNLFKTHLFKVAFTDK